VKRRGATSTPSSYLRESISIEGPGTPYNLCGNRHTDIYIGERFTREWNNHEVYPAHSGKRTLGKQTPSSKNEIGESMR